MDKKSKSFVVPPLGGLSLLSRKRLGLAMIELVLALPMLLFIMALIINAGTIGAWKVREQSVARLAVWETRWPRSGNDPTPDYWPSSGTAGASDQGNVTGMDDSSVDLPVARGPMPPATVNNNLLDETRGLRGGHADLSRSYPLMAKLGKYDIQASTFLVDDKWQYNTPTMGMPHNLAHRIPIIYTLPTAASSMMSGYIGAAMAILDGSLQSALSPLDHDSDFIYYSALFSGGPGSAPDFQPRVQRFCSTDKTTSDAAVQNVIDRINNLDTTMTERFLRLYKDARRRFEAILAAKPPAPASQQALANQQIPILNTDISQLQGGSTGTSGGN